MWVSGYQMQDPEKHFPNTVFDVAINGIDHQETKQKIHDIIYPLRYRFWGAILGYQQELLCCQWSAALMTDILQAQLPGHRIGLGFGIPQVVDTYKYHYWTEVDETILVDPTHGIFDETHKTNMHIGDITDLQKYGITRFDRHAAEPAFSNYRPTQEYLRTKPFETDWLWEKNRAIENGSVEYTERVRHSLSELLQKS